MLKNNNPDHKLTTEELRAGGIASGKTRRRKKNLREIGDIIGQLPIKNADNINIMQRAGVDVDDMTYDFAMIFRLSLKAQSGDTRAIELLSKLRGQMIEHIETIDLTPPIPLSPRKKGKK